MKRLSLVVRNNGFSGNTDRFAGKFHDAYRCVCRQSYRFHGDGAHYVCNGNNCAALQSCQKTNQQTAATQDA